MKIGVKIMPKREVLDSQGRAVESTLVRHGKEVGSCRVGRYVELELNEGGKDKAMAKARDIASFVLHNPLIEDFELEEL